ncbi:MAG: TRAP transporter small permease [Pseudomonadota bacterium]
MAAESFVAALCYFIAASILIVDVVARNVFATAWLGTTSMAVLASVVAGFLGLSLATSSGSHLRVEAFDALIPSRWSWLAGKLGHAVSAALFLFIAWHAFFFVVESASWGDRVRDLTWPLWIFQTIMPWAFASTALRHLYLIYRPQAVDTQE